MFGGRPPTGSLANRPSSRAAGGNQIPRGNTSMARPGTGLRPSTGFQVSDRPTTQQGLGGMRIGTQTSRGRVVQDSTYFCAELRQKITLLNGEIATLNNEAEQITRENTNMSSFEKRADIISDELKELQGQLGDLNTLVDKLHVDADLEDIERAYIQLREKNQRENKTLEEIFSLRQQKENQVKDVESLIENEIKKSEHLINALPIEKRNLYKKRKEENTTFLQDIDSKQKELEGLSTKIEALNKELKMDSLKQKSLSLHEKRFELYAKKQEIESDLRALGQETGPQEKAKLLDQVKEDNIETVAMERKISDLEDEAKKLKEQIAQLDMDLDTTQQSERNAKFDELVRRDKEMQIFIDSHPSKMKEHRERNEEMERTIVNTLDKMRILAKTSSSSMPTEQEHRELKGDLKFKEKEMKNSEHTAESLIVERDKRLLDLEKVNQLETKLDIEMRQLKSKKSNLVNEMKKVGNIEKVKEEAEAKKKKNSVDREILLVLKETLKSRVSVLSAKHDAKNAQLNENETYNHLSSLEQKLRHHESNNYHLKEFIATKKAESDYKSVAAGTMKLTDEINSQLIKIMSIPPAR